MANKKYRINYTYQSESGKRTRMKDWGYYKDAKSAVRDFKRHHDIGGKAKILNVTAKLMK